MDNDMDNDLEDISSQATISFKEETKRDAKYQYRHVSMTEVIANIDEYIISELQEACKSLWDRNIFTYMCSNREDDDEAYIVLEKLSPENTEIFEQLRKKHPENFTIDYWRYNRFCINIPDVTQMSEEEISSAFLKLSSYFVPQDVQNDFYLTKEDYLILYGCYKEVPNPNYVEDVDSVPIVATLEEIDKWFEKSGQPKTIKVFSKNKMTKSFEEYVKENGDEHCTDFNTGKVYRSPYFLNDI